MSRSKKDWNDTESMLARLSSLLLEHRDHGINTEMGLPSLVARDDAEQLRRISMILHTWFEHECNGNIQRANHTLKDGTVLEADGLPYWHSSQDGTRRWRVPDRERGATRRLQIIMKRYPALIAYVQTDPRGCALYIFKPGDVPEGADVSAYYSRGLAVFK